MAARESRNWERSHEGLDRSTDETTTYSASPAGNDSPGTYYHSLSAAQRLGNSPVNVLTQFESIAQGDYLSPQSRPSTSGSGPAAGTSSSIASPSHTRPFAPGLLHAHDSSLETPSTTSGTSSPMTPFTPYGQGATPIIDTGATPGASGQDYGINRQRYDSLLTLSPVQVNERMFAGRHQPLEPPTESSMSSQFRGGSAHLQFFSTDSRGKNSPAPSQEPSP